MSEAVIDGQRDRFLSWLAASGVVAPRLLETHVSFLAFAGDRVWKCKKAVQFPFVDLSTLDRRRANCEREVALNRRLAPDVYLGVEPVVSAGAVVDAVVVMRALPDERRLSAIATAAHAGGECTDAIAERLARFHAEAATGGDIDAVGSPESLARLWAQNLEEMRQLDDAAFDAATLDRVERDGAAYLAGRNELFADRIARGRIRDGHGDLLADDVFCLADGPRILDCLEFDDGLRFGDVVADVAFLAMDLEWLGRPELARRLLDRYALATGDAWPPSLEEFYVAARALVRAKVAGLRVGDDEDAPRAASGHLALAAAHLQRGRVRLVLIGGAPATGKTTVARELARITGWPALHSDEVRKELAGIGPTESASAGLDEGLYAPAWSDRTYAALLERAGARLRMGESVILDASWSARDHRRTAAALAASTASELDAFVCEVPAAVADARADDRTRRRDDASDATAVIARAVGARFDPWPASARVDTIATPEAVRHMLEILGRFEPATTDAPEPATPPAFPGEIAG
jgi:aminoglycoside phosphotransferase family enzyme/predicted kinase